MEDLHLKASSNVDASESALTLGSAMEHTSTMQCLSDEADHGEGSQSGGSSVLLGSESPVRLSE